jgi:uncharacterized protein YjbJ (UPF0337 family)
MKMNRKSKYLGHAAQGNAEQATGEARSDDELIVDGREDQVKGDLKQVAEGVEDAFED